MVNGENHTGHTSNKNTLWIAGWMWGKYPEQAQIYCLLLDEIIRNQPVGSQCSVLRGFSFRTQTTKFINR